MKSNFYQQFTHHEEHFDALIIGSGIGGLSVASLLAQAGKKVLVLERHYIIGGYTHVFQRKTYEWDVGLHYVGEVHIEGTSLNKAFRYLSKGKLQWAPLDNTYDRIVFQDKEYEFVRGRANLRAKLKEYFPENKDQKSIDEYFKLLDEVKHVGVGYYVEKVIPLFFAKLFGPLLRKRVLKYSNKFTLDVLNTITDNQELIGVLTAQYGDYGLPPSKSSFYMHALLANHYMEGAGYPVGGSANIAQTIVPVIEEHGGAVLFNAEVQSIIVENNIAKGVQMFDGKKIFADVVISDAGAINTFLKLLPEESIEKHGFREKLKKLEPSAAHMGLYMGIKEPASKLKMPRCNYWIFPDEYDHEKNQALYKNFQSDLPVIFVSFPSAKDLAWEKKHPNLSTAEAIIIVPYDWFSKWENTTWKNRGVEYENLKKQIAEQMLEKVYSVQPKLRGKIDYFEVSSPLSTKKFTGYQHGEIYGVAHTPERFRQDFLKPYTPVKNLFLTGQDAMIASIAGGLMGGVLCASAILKKDMLRHITKTIR